MHSHNSHHLPSLSQLTKATGMSLIVAAAILLAAVLPAEFGIDPTGIGKVLGFTKMKPPVTEAASAIAPVAPVVALPAATVAQTQPVTVTKSAVPFRSDEISLTLKPSEGTEVKATMQKGEQFVFSWEVEGGKVNFDMHGEPPNAGNNFTSYWKDKEQASAQGTFVAPFSGTHGWFWRNRGDKPVTVKVKVSGFYEKISKQ
jgi:hypothetical protein